MSAKRLSDHLPSMRAEDVLVATEEAKVRARTLLEDQGITLLALLLADFLADTLAQDMLGRGLPVYHHL